jgi:tetratricopeptide (TPR) repeat protein
MRYGLNDIKNYVEGTMSQEDRLIFERLINSDEDLKLMVDGYKEMKDNGYSPDTWIESRKILPSKSKNHKRIILNMAATLTVILAISCCLYYLSNRTQFHPPSFKDAGIPIYMNQEKVNKWATIMELYRNENFDEAFQQILILEKNYNSSDTSIYYKGVFLKESGNCEDAITIFNRNKIKDPLLKGKADVQKIDCLWKLGLHEDALKHYNEATSDKEHFIHHLLNDR